MLNKVINSMWVMWIKQWITCVDKVLYVDKIVDAWKKGGMG
jgi:hypothetical protein